MTTTLEIPDNLYRKVEAKSKALGRKLPDVTAELYERWVAEDEAAPGSNDAQDWPDKWVNVGRKACTDSPAAVKLESWFRDADEAFADAPSGPSAREILQSDRDRLERR